MVEGVALLMPLWASLENQGGGRRPGKDNRMTAVGRYQGEVKPQPWWAEMSVFSQVSGDGSSLSEHVAP